MKRLLLGLVVALGMLMSGWLGWDVPSASATNLTNAWSVAPVLAEEALRNAVDDKLSTEYGSKLDLNNANVQAFVKYKGMYPTIAGKILKSAPFETVQDVLDIPGLSDREIDIIESNLNNFTVTPPDPAFVEGADRYNNGVYR
ncbi:photosystem II complex extrinsic protein PsbU [Oscillatoria sp. CS-180]|uniref:photosystem II complex extrinsic protein PsbU n=1 Tax=Oscillatoria sp. CS-180 TaxID=3021720 RepID=UPI00232B531C|nr:photosystem II complex extrinsic protein PsbU [Oscillatoria sp. CS-180]MDB9526250.1 photosystem II complex extrinsic protein PsbU [Oscillatoria sp. CS-180]